MSLVKIPPLKINRFRRCPEFLKPALVLLVFCALVYAPNRACAQGADAYPADNSAQAPQSSDNGDSSSLDREVTWGTLPKDFLRDQKDIWMFPVQLAKGRHWLPTLAIAGVTAGLIVADPHVSPYFQSHARNLDRLNDVFDSPITTAEVAALPVSLMIAGYIRHDSYQVSTALLAGEAYADSAVVDLAIKAITRRKRPSDVAPGASFNDTFFSGAQSPLKGSAFPSGHAAGAFSVATVIAGRYRTHRWVPWVAYGFATAISFSRVTSGAHFPSDVFLGAALGYSIARFEVLRRH
jgi:membrane-associated phospholipid phosphatase